MVLGFALGLIFAAVLASVWGMSRRGGENSSWGKLLRCILVDGILENFSSFKFFDLRQAKVFLSLLLVGQFVVPSLFGGQYLAQDLYAPLLFDSAWTPTTHRVFYGLFSLALALGLVVTPRKSLAGILTAAWTSIFYLYTALLLGFNPYNITNLSAGTFIICSFFAAITTFWSIFMTYYGTVTVGSGRKPHE